MDDGTQIGWHGGRPGHEPESRACQDFGCRTDDCPTIGMRRIQAVGIASRLSAWCTHWCAVDFEQVGQLSVSLRLSTGSTVLWYRNHGDSGKAELLVSGPWSRAVQVPHEQVSHSEVVFIRPGAVRAVFGLPASELAGRRLPLGEVLPEDDRFLREQLAVTAGTLARRDILLTWLASRIARHARPDDEEMVKGIIGWLQRPVGSTDIAHCVGGSQRQVQRWFADALGMPPRSFSRLWRVGRVVREALRSPDPDWARMAVNHGFSDQSHLVRQWRSVMGEPPDHLHRRWRTGGRWVGGMIVLPRAAERSGP